MMRDNLCVAKCPNCAFIYYMHNQWSRYYTINSEHIQPLSFMNVLALALILYTSYFLTKNNPEVLQCYIIYICKHKVNL